MREEGKVAYKRIDPKIRQKGTGTDSYTYYLGTDLWGRQWEIMRFNPVSWTMVHKSKSGKEQFVHVDTLLDADTLLGGNPVSASKDKARAEVADVKILPEVLHKMDMDAKRRRP